MVLTGSAAKGFTHLEHAWVADDGSVDSFSEGIVALIRDRNLAEKLTRQARLLVETRHSRSSMVERVEELYQKILAQ